MSFSPLSVEVQGLSGGGSGPGSGEPIVIQNHLFMNEREIASIVSDVTAKVGNNCERHFRWVVSR